MPYISSPITALIVICNFLLFVTCIADESSPCFAPPGSCACEYSGGVIYLSELGLLQTVSDQGKYAYYIDVCGEVDQHRGVPPDCTGSSVCQYDKEHSWYKAGLAGSYKFIGQPEKSLQISYSAQKDKDVYRRSVIHLDCNMYNETFSFLNQTGSGHDEDQPIVFSFQYSGLKACLTTPLPPTHHKLSGGSVLLILFFVAVIIYVIGGVIINKCLRGAIGLELIPNYEFWADLPSLVKDGFQFTMTCGCCANEQPAYDNI